MREKEGGRRGRGILREKEGGRRGRGIEIEEKKEMEGSGGGREGSQIVTKTLCRFSSVLCFEADEG